MKKKRTNATINAELAGQSAGNVGAGKIGQTLENGESVQFMGEHPFTIVFEVEKT